MPRDHYTLPCMIKAAQGKGKRGTFLVRTEEHAQKAFSELSKNFCDAEIVITEVIEDILKCLIVQMYLFQDGHIYCLGVKHKTNRQFCKETANCVRPPDVDWNEQEQLKEEVWDLVIPVTKYLHENGYFGFVGIEILVNNKGKYVIDVNLKISSSTNLLLISPHMAALNYPVSYVLDVLPTNIRHMLDTIDRLNSRGEGRIVLLADGSSNGESPHKACVVIFAKNSEKALILERELTKLTEL